jgi:hypothetical protein
VLPTTRSCAPGGRRNEEPLLNLVSNLGQSATDRYLSARLRTTRAPSPFVPSGPADEAPAPSSVGSVPHRSGA